jgi:hypothetical protein
LYQLVYVESTDLGAKHVIVKAKTGHIVERWTNKMGHGSY